MIVSSNPGRRPTALAIAEELRRNSGSVAARLRIEILPGLTGATEARWQLREGVAPKGAFAATMGSFSLRLLWRRQGFKFRAVLRRGFRELFEMPPGAGGQVTGWRRGRQLGLISFLAPAAVYNGVKLDGLAVARKGRGLFKGSGPARRVAAMRSVVG